MTEKELIQLVLKSKELTGILAITEELNLPEACLCAGSIRNYIWNQLSQKSNYVGDVDVIFFDPETTYDQTLIIEEELQKKYPNYLWEVRNQTHMHIHNPGVVAYTSVYDALSKFPERCTAIGLRKKGKNYELIAPYGIEDILDFYVQPTPHFQETAARMTYYKQRVEKKKWHEYWTDIHYLET